MEKFVKTRFDNIYVFNDKFVDINSEDIYMKQNSNNKFVIGNEELTREEILSNPRKYDSLPIGFERLYVYDKHMFKNRLYYYNKDTNEILINRANHFLNLKSRSNKNKHLFSLVDDNSKTCQIISENIVQHEQNSS